MTQNLLLFTSLLALSACSIQFDSQYGIRFEPAKIEADAPHTHSKSAETWNAIGSVEHAETVESEKFALAAAVLASCSITKDAQRGISFEFQHLHQGRQSDHVTGPEAPTAKAGVPAQYQGQESALESALVGEGMERYPTSSDFSAPTAGANDYLDGANEALEAMDQAALIQESESPSSVTPAIDAAMDEPSILNAWIMWGIPVLLMFFGIGFLLNFGLHWYYLGKMRRASKSTYIWALTLSASLVVAFLNWLQLTILAAIVGIFLLLPLVAIQLIRVIKDASLLNKMAKRAARNPFKAKQRSA